MADDDVEVEEKTPAQIERESIKVTIGEPEAKEPEKEVEKENDAEEDNNEEEAEGENDKEELDEEKEEPKELTDDQKAIQALEKKLERAQRRAGKTAQERDENKNKIKELQAALDAKLAEGEQPLTPEEVKRQARVLADQDLTAREFIKAQEKLVEDATKVDKTFMSKVRDLAADVAPLPEFFIGALANIEHDNGGAVLNHLTDNPDEYEEILKLTDPTRVMTKLIRISDKLYEASKPKPKKISNAPEPGKPPGGNRKSPDTLPLKPTEDMAEFVRIRAMQDKAKREARGE